MGNIHERGEGEGLGSGDGDAGMYAYTGMNEESVTERCDTTK
jgi:hypothetical protein